jgi:hypothetical protein
VRLTVARRGCEAHGPLPWTSLGGERQPGYRMVVGRTLALRGVFTLTLRKEGGICGKLDLLQGLVAGEGPGWGAATCR